MTECSRHPCLGQTGAEYLYDAETEGGPCYRRCHHWTAASSGTRRGQAAARGLGMVDSEVAVVSAQRHYELESNYLPQITDSVIHSESL